MADDEVHQIPEEHDADGVNVTGRFGRAAAVRREEARNQLAGLSVEQLVEQVLTMQESDETEHLAIGQERDAQRDRAEQLERDMAELLERHGDQVESLRERYRAEIAEAKSGFSSARSPGDIAALNAKNLRAFKLLKFGPKSAPVPESAPFPRTWEWYRTVIVRWVRAIGFTELAKRLTVRGQVPSASELPNTMRAMDSAAATWVATRLEDVDFFRDSFQGTDVTESLCDIVRFVDAQTLLRNDLRRAQMRREFEAFNGAPGESVTSIIERFWRLYGESKRSGCQWDDEDVRLKLLFAMPDAPFWDAIRSQRRTFDGWPVQRLVEHLRAEAQGEKAAMVSAPLVAPPPLVENAVVGVAASSAGRSRPQRPSERGTVPTFGGPGSRRSQQRQARTPRGGITCYECKATGHLMQECPDRKALGGADEQAALEAFRRIRQRQLQLVAAKTRTAAALAEEDELQRGEEPYDCDEGEQVVDPVVAAHLADWLDEQDSMDAAAAAVDDGADDARAAARREQRAESEALMAAVERANAPNAVGGLAACVRTGDGGAPVSGRGEHGSGGVRPATRAESGTGETSLGISNGTALVLGTAPIVARHVAAARTWISSGASAMLLFWLVLLGAVVLSSASTGPRGVVGAAAAGPWEPTTFICDSGAYSCIVRDRALFDEYEPGAARGGVGVAGHALTVVGSGVVRAWTHTTSGWRQLSFRALHCPTAQFNLTVFSPRAVVRLDGVSCSVRCRTMTMRHGDGHNKLLVPLAERHGVPTFVLTPERPPTAEHDSPRSGTGTCATAVRSYRAAREREHGQPFGRLHDAAGHLCLDHLRWLKKGGHMRHLDFNIPSKFRTGCRVCERARTKRVGHPTKIDHAVSFRPPRATANNERWFVDMSGNTRHVAVDGSVCFFVAVDDWTNRYMAVPLKAQSDVHAAIATLINRYGKPAAVRLDNAQNLLGGAFREVR